jgi:hypothetical protein
VDRQALPELALLSRETYAEAQEAMERVRQALEGSNGHHLATEVRDAVAAGLGLTNGNDAEGRSPPVEAQVEAQVEAPAELGHTVLPSSPPAPAPAPAPPAAGLPAARLATATATRTSRTAAGLVPRAARRPPPAGWTGFVARHTEVKP